MLYFLVCFKVIHYSRYFVTKETNCIASAFNIDLILNEQRKKCFLADIEQAIISISKIELITQVAYIRLI